MGIERRYDPILFDFDGTIYDSGEGIIRCLKETAAEFNLPEPPLNILRRFVGPPLKMMFEKIFDLEPDEAQKLVDFYRKNYRESEGYLQGHVYDGVAEMLKKLNILGFTCAIASAKKEYTVIDTLKYYDLYKYFKVVRGAEIHDEYANKARIITDCLMTLGISESEYSKVLMVGDTVYDGEAAGELKIDFAAAMWGYGFVTKEELNSVPYIFKAETPERLLDEIIHNNA